MFTWHVRPGMMRNARLAVAMVVAVTLAACGGLPGGPRGPVGGGELGVTVTDLKLAATTVAAGSVIAATYTLKNVGTETTPPLRVWASIRSDGATWPAPSVPDDAWEFVPEMAAGESRDLSAALRVSTDAQPGQLFLWVTIEAPEVSQGTAMQGGAAKVAFEVTAFETAAQWAVQLGSDKDDGGRTIAALADGGVMIAGMTDGSMPGAAAAGSGRDDVFVSRLSEEGEALWLAQFGVAGSSDYLTLAGMAVDGEGNVVVAGNTTGTLPDNASAGNTDAYIAKFDGDGQLLWMSQFGTNSHDYLSGFGVGADNSVTVTGYTSGVFPGASHSGNNDVFVMKLSAAGEQTWVTQFGSDDDDFANGLQLAADGSAYVYGNTYAALPGNEYGGGDSRDVFLARLGESGSVLWISQLGSAGHESIETVLLDPAGGAVLGGSTNGSLPGADAGNAGSYDAYVARFSEAGTRLWVQQFGTTDREGVTDLAMDSGGAGIVAVGYTLGTLEGTPASDMEMAFVTKLNATGTRVWTRQFGSGYIASAVGVHVTASGAVLVLGENDGQMPGANIFNDDDIFLSEFSATGEWQSTRQFGSDEAEVIHGFAVGADDSLYVVGETDGALVEGEPNKGGEDVFVVKFGL